MMQLDKPTDNPCRFDQFPTRETLRRYDELIERESCPHINKLGPPRIDGVHFYAVMDSNCFRPQPPLSAKCDKRESRNLRFVVCRDFAAKVEKLRYADYCARSLMPSRAVFPQGETTQGQSSIQSKSPLVILNFYTKGQQIDCCQEFVEVETKSTTELLYAPVVVEVTAWKNEERKGFTRGKITLNIAVPPKGGEMELAATQLIIEALKLLMQDGYKFLKARAVKIPEKGAIQPFVIYGSKTVDSSNLTLLTPVISEIARIGLETKIDQLRTKMKRYQDTRRQINSLEGNLSKSTTGSDTVIDRARLCRP